MEEKITNTEVVDELQDILNSKNISKQFSTEDQWKTAKALVVAISVLKREDLRIRVEGDLDFWDSSPGRCCPLCGFPIIIHNGPKDGCEQHSCACGKTEMVIFRIAEEAISWWRIKK
jgi:hypothetical protein